LNLIFSPTLCTYAEFPHSILQGISSRIPSSISPSTAPPQSNLSYPHIFQELLHFLAASFYSSTPKLLSCPSSLGSPFLAQHLLDLTVALILTL